MTEPGNAQRPMLIISDDKVPTSAYQAIYHKLTSKVEKINEIFDEIYEIKIEDILHLHNILDSALGQFSIKGKKEEISLSLHKGESFTFSSFEKFYRFNFGTTCCTSKIVYDLDFFSILPVEIKDAEDIVQRFKISIVMDQDFVEDGESNIPMFMRSMWAGQNISMKIEYSDYSVARNIQGVVRDWVSGLPTKHKSPLRKWLTLKNEFAVYFIPRFFSFGSLMACATFILTEYSGRQDNFPQLIVVSMAISILVHIFGHVLIIQFYRMMQLGGALTFIMITEGDRRRFSKINYIIRRRGIISNFLMVPIFGGVVASLIASYIFLAFFTLK